MSTQSEGAADLARAGRKRARRFAAEVRSQMPGVDPSEIARAGRRQANRLANEVRAYVPEVPTSGISRAMRRLFG